MLQWQAPAGARQPVIGRTCGRAAARAESPPDTRHIVMAYTQQTDRETVPVGKQSDCVPPKSVLSLDSPPYEMNEVYIRLGTAPDNRVDTEERETVVRRTPSYNIPADVGMW